MKSAREARRQANIPASRQHCTICGGVNTRKSSDTQAARQKSCIMEEHGKGRYAANPHRNFRKQSRLLYLVDMPTGMTIFRRCRLAPWATQDGFSTTFHVKSFPGPFTELAYTGRSVTTIRRQTRLVPATLKFRMCSLNKYVETRKNRITQTMLVLPSVQVSVSINIQAGRQPRRIQTDIETEDE